jgi:hypothetical protein
LIEPTNNQTTRKGRKGVIKGEGVKGIKIIKINAITFTSQ